MAGPTDHNALHEMSGLYVLGSLSREDRAIFETHLAGCPACADEVRSLTRVSGSLAQLPPQIPPSPALRARVLAAVGRLEASAEPAPLAAAAAGAFGSLSWLAAAASIVLAAGLGVYASQLRGRIGALEDQLREATLRADANERQMADLRRVSAEAQSQVAVLASPDLARVDLAGQPVAPSASARAFWSRSRGLVFTASDLPALPPGRIYQLWVVTAQAPISAGLVRPDQTGRVNAVFQTPPDIPQPVAMAVTIEPDGGVPAPTGDRYLIGTVASRPVS
jgi:anti-sigma-K factor RskA